MSTEAGAAPSAGWYPDPGGTKKLRYWNGRAWTQHVSPPDPPQPAPASTPNPVAQPAAPAPAAPMPMPPAATAQTATPAGPAAPAPVQAPMVDPRVLQSTPPPAGVPLTPTPPSPRAGERLGPDAQVLSGWWRRLGGYLIDGIAVGLVALVVVALYGAVSGGFGELVNTSAWNDFMDKASATPGYQPTPEEVQAIVGADALRLFGVYSLVSLVLGVLNGVVLVARSGQTVGDRVVGNRKVIEGRRVPSFGAAALRWLIPAVLVALQALPALGVLALLVWALDYLWPLWDRRNQTLHDKAARTYVERSSLVGPVHP